MKTRTALAGAAAASANPFARIVVGYDDSDAADAALAQAVRLAEPYGGEIVAVNVSDLSAAAMIPIRSAVPAPRTDFAPVLASVDSARRELFQKLCDRVASHHVAVTFELTTAEPAEGLIDAAARWNATAIAVGTHTRHGLARVLTASLAETLVRTAAVPVIVVHAEAHPTELARVVVAVDGSAHSANVSAFAVALALEHAVQLIYCTVIDTADIMPPSVELAFDSTPLLHEMRGNAWNALDDALQHAVAHGLCPDAEVVDAADPATGIAQIATRQGAGAIVVGTRKRGSAERFFLGSTAFDVLRRAGVPVIVVPADAPVIPEPAAAAEHA